MGAKRLDANPSRALAPPRQYEILCPFMRSNGVGCPTTDRQIHMHALQVQLAIGIIGRGRLMMRRRSS
jgi:hypothetical protein